MASKLPPRLSVDDMPIIPPPSTVIVDFERKPVLFTHDGKALVRKIGY